MKNPIGSYERRIKPLSVAIAVVLYSSLSGAVALSATPPQDNLLINGGFEQSSKRVSEQSWGFSRFQGWQGDGEVWGKRYGGKVATEGRQKIELDVAKKVDSLSQAVRTEAGIDYELSLDAYARHRGSSEFEIWVDDDKIKTVSPAAQWGRHKISFKGNGKSRRIMLKEVAKQNDGLGAIIDNVRLVKLGDGGEPKTKPPVANAAAVGSLNVGSEGKGLEQSLSEESVLLLGVPGGNEEEPGVAVVMDGADGRKQIKFSEWDYLDGKHAEEEIPWLAAKPGRYVGEDGTIAEVGVIELSRMEKGGKVWAKTGFGKAFPNKPLLLLTPQSRNEDRTYSVHARRVNKRGFSAQLREQESNSGLHGVEQVAYLALYHPDNQGKIDMGHGEIAFEARYQLVSHEAVDIFGHSIYLQEEQSKDKETKHGKTWLAMISIDGRLFAQDNAGRGRNPHAPRLKAAGELQIGGLKVTDVTSESIALGWSPAKGEEADKITGYRVLRDGIPVADTQQTQYIDSGLPAETGYNYQIAGLNAAGLELVKSSAIKVKTGKDDNQPNDLTAPRSLRAKAAGSDQVDLIWQAPAQGKVNGYKVRRDGKLIGTASDTRFSDKTTQGGKKYHYSVNAFGDRGESKAVIVSITTPIAKDTLPPSKPQQLKAIKVGADSVTLSWQASEDNIGVVGYEIERDGEKIADSKTPGFTDNKLEPLKSYSYKVIAYDAAGNRSGQAVVSITTVAIPDTQAPTVPKNLKAEADQDAKVIRLSWDAAGDNVAVLGYQIIRNGKELTKTDSTGYADHDVEAGKSYNYQVEAFDAAGNNSGAGDAVSAKIDQPPAIAPVTGATLAATCAGCHGSDGQSEGDAIPTLAGMDKSYFSGVMASYQNGKRYSTMMGRIAGAYSEDEISKMGDYFARQNFTPAKQSINLSRAQQGQKLHGNNSCNSCHGSDGKDNGNGTLAGQWMPYMIATLDDYAERRSSDGAKSMRDKLKQMSAADRLALAHYYASHGSDTQAPDAPADLAIAAKTETSLTLSWTDADDDSRVARYEIHRDGVKIGETELNSYTDTGLKAATVYSYDVYAVDAVGNRSIDAADVTGKTRGEPEVVDPDVDRGHNLWTANGCTTCHQSPEVFTDKLEKKYGKDVDVAKVLTTAIKTNLGGMGVFSGLSEQDIKDMDAYVNSETGGTSPGDPSSIEGVNLMSNAQTVRKAAILLAGRLPTEQELKQAKDEAGLHKAVKGLMKGEKFAEFIYNTANEWFLTAGAVPGAPKILTGTFGGFGAQGADGVTRLADMRREPLEMARFIVENDRSWEEMLTADYSVVSRTNLSKVYKGRAVNLGGAVKAGWTPGRYGYAAEGFKGGPNTRPFWATSHLKEPYPHAGVLSSLSWLARFPTNGTNRNRHRTRILYRTFLGVDIEALAERPTDSTDLGDYPIPVMQNPNCTVCHTSMDPAAGAFMDFGEKMPYRSEGVDSLDGLYKGRSYPRHPDTGKQWYQNGDHWYRDVFAPGYEGKKMPGGVYGFKGRDPSTGKVPNAENDNGAKNAMAWMARELVKDPRFAVGAVRFWYRGLFGREALWAPQDNTAPAYAANLAAFQVENKIIDQLAKDFRKGGHKVRDLLAGLVLSDLFRAGTTDLNLGKAKLATLSRTGMGRLLRYQELNNKAEALVGKPVFNDSASDIMTFIYSGFDGGALTSERNAELTPVMAAAYEQRLNAVLCDEHLVNSDFKLPAAQRKFFPYVELYHQAKGSKPDPKSDGKDVSHIRRNIQHLHAHLLGEELPLDDAEIDRTFALFSEVQAMGFDDSGLRYNQGPAFTCEGQTNKIEHTRKGTLYLIDRRKAIADPYGTHRAWNAVLSYLLGDVRMLND